MATDFWASSHYKRWIVDRATLTQARVIDMLYVETQYLDYLSIYFANIITKLGKKLQFKQKIIATATVFFRRFYLKNAYCETDPFTVIAACCYVAAKAEESPVHIKVVVTESRALFSQEMYGVKNFSSDNTKLAEMEFYLVGDLDCDLVVFHPYRTLLSLCRKEASNSSSSLASEEGEADDLGVGIAPDDGPRYWGTGEGQLELPAAALQTAWSIINDTYKSDMCLAHPPHLIAIAAIYLTFILHPPARSESSGEQENDHSPEPTPVAKQPRRSSRQAAASSQTVAHAAKKPQDPITFLANLNVSLPLITTIAQEILSLYSIWDSYKEDVTPESKQAREMTHSPLSNGGSPSKRSVSGYSNSGRNITSDASMIFEDEGMTPGKTVSTPSADTGTGQQCVTPQFLSATLQRMREARLADLAPASPLPIPSTHSSITGRQVAVNKRLERTQAVG